MPSTLDPVTNSETWRQEFYAYDDDVGPDEFIDLTSAIITFTIRNQETHCAEITGATTSGEVILTGEPGVFSLSLAQGRLSNLSGNYDIGIRVSVNGEISDLYVGTLPIIDGIDR